MQLEHPRDDRKRVVYNPEDRDWTALYDEHQVGIFKKPSLARKALDDYVYELARRGKLTPEPATQPDHAAHAEQLGDPLTLYFPGGPDAAIPVAAEDLDAALALFCATYDQPKVQERAQRARSLLDQQSRWAIQPDGSVRIIGKGSTYLVTDEACRTIEGKDCPDQKYRTGITGGQCYHTISRELLRLAQVLARQAQQPDLAFVRLSGRLLGLALAIVYLAEQPVIWRLAAGRLTLLVGTDPTLHELTLSGSDGDGDAMLSVAAADLVTLWGEIKPVATQLEQIAVFVDPLAQQLTLTAEGFSATAPGTGIEQSA